MKLYPFIAICAALCTLTTGDVLAARAKDKLPVGTVEPLTLPAANPTVKRVQQALSDAGYYKGPIDGVFNELTNEAIRNYQRREGLPQDGIASKELAAHIETSAKVQSLLKQLERQRLEKIEEARKALLANPETRDLVTKPKESERKAKADRDPTTCFADPTPTCLLDEASQSAIAIAKNEFRDWVLGEILVAQAKAGLVESALETVRLIGDPRLIMVALRDIAEAQASAGRPAEALSAADIIPDPQKHLEALAAIAAIQISRGDREGASNTANRLLSGLSQISAPLKRVSLNASAVIILAKAGNSAQAAKELQKLKSNAETVAKNGHRNTALRHLANAYAETGEPEMALEILKDVPDVKEHTPVLVSAATAQADAGDAEKAIITAESIEAVRYRAVVLSRIALAQARAGSNEDSRKTLEKASEAASTIERAFARAYAFERISRALIEIGGFGGKDTFKETLYTAGLIGDDKLRAHTLWTLATNQRLLGHELRAQEAEQMAENATEKIISPFTKVWMFSEIALEHLAAGRIDTAGKIFNRALGIAQNIDSPWGRSRALARLASSLIELSLK